MAEVDFKFKQKTLASQFTREAWQHDGEGATVPAMICPSTSTLSSLARILKSRAMLATRVSVALCLLELLLRGRPHPEGAGVRV